jgi:hypothetical protein
MNLAEMENLLDRKKKLCDNGDFAYRAPEMVETLIDELKHCRKRMFNEITEVIVLEGGYGITCNFCAVGQGEPCDHQVSGLTCLKGVRDFMRKALEDASDIETGVDEPEKFCALCAHFKITDQYGGTCCAQTGERFGEYTFNKDLCNSWEVML